MSEPSQLDVVHATLALPAASASSSGAASSSGGWRSRGDRTDVDLIAEYRAGNLAAYAELAGRYQIPLFRLLLGLLGDEDLAEQACEEVFVVANRRLDELVRPGEFYRWLLGLAREVSRELLEQHGGLEPTVPPEAQAPREQIKHEVHTALQQLDPDLRLALVLVEFRHAHHAEVAAALGCDTGAVPSIVEHAREAFTKALGSRELRPKTINDSGMAADVPQLSSGDVIAGRYQIDSLLGVGGMGVVYRARDLVGGGEDVAIKTMLPGRSTSVKALRRFEREAEAIGRLNHENFVKILDFGSTPEAMRYMVMEYLRGRPLTELLGELCVAPRRALLVIRQILAGLAHAHAHGVVHRDLKPENVIVLQTESEADRAKILDLGLAMLVDSDEPEATDETRLTREGLVFGTPAYMAPEQALGHAVDARVDVYAAAVMLFELLTGRLPFVAVNPSALLVKHVSQPVPLLESIAPHLAGCDALQDLIDAGLSKKPKDRIPSADAFVERIDAVLELDLPEASGSFQPQDPDEDFMTMTLTSALPEVSASASKAGAAEKERGQLSGLIVSAIVAAIAFAIVLWALGGR